MKNTLKSIKEVFIRYKPVYFEKPLGETLDSSAKVSFITLELLKDIDEERLITYYIDIRNKIICYAMSGVGGVNYCSVSMGRIFRPAIHQGSSAVILAHNHPSGFIEPSKEDLKLTKRAFMAGRYLDIDVLDHVIVAENRYYSIRENHIDIFKS